MIWYRTIKRTMANAKYNLELIYTRSFQKIIPLRFTPTVPKIPTVVPLGSPLSAFYGDPLTYASLLTSCGQVSHVNIAQTLTFI